MKAEYENKRIRRSQKDYSYSFKMLVVNEVEQGLISVTGAQRKYGSRNYLNLGRKSSCWRSKRLFSRSR
jgi:hypothetical protein